MHGGRHARSTAPTLIDDPRADGGLQRFPDITADSGQPQALWWDSRNDGYQRGRLATVRISTILPHWTLP